MPTAPLRPCTAPGCPVPTDGGRCRRHHLLADKQRTNRGLTLYGREWPRVRLEYLARNPHCILCGRMASIADHHPRGIRLLRKQGNAEPHADRHLRPLCRPCHSRETGRHEPGGWHRNRMR